MRVDNYKQKTKSAIRNICISTVILFVGIILVAKSFVVEDEKKNFIYSYNKFQNVNYTVNLKPNDFYNTTTLGMDKTYVSELVDKINMDFTYSLQGTKKGKFKYNYQVVAYTQVKYAASGDSKGGILLEDQEVLLEPKEVEVEESGYSINESVQVDYAKYNSRVSQFASLYRLPLDATLNVKLIVISESQVEGVPDIINEYSVLDLQMDLDESVVTVKKNFNNTDKKEIADTQESKKYVNKPMFIIGAILIVGAVLILLDSIRKSIKFTQKSDYAIALNRILKNYGDIVAEIVSPIEVDNLNVIEVKNFDQLLDIEEEIRMPILFYETIEGESGEFIIICDTMAYRYIIGG